MRWLLIIIILLVFSMGAIIAIAMLSNSRGPQYRETDPFAGVLADLAMLPDADEGKDKSYAEVIS